MKLIKNFISRIVQEEVERVAEKVYQERVREAICRMEHRVDSLVDSSLINNGFNRFKSRLNDIEYQFKIGMSEVNKHNDNDQRNPGRVALMSLRLCEIEKEIEELSRRFGGQEIISVKGVFE